MESQLRDANWRLQQLQTQYDFLASKSFTQGNAYKDAEEKAEVTNNHTYVVRSMSYVLNTIRTYKKSKKEN